jgi:hypothetical protein
VAIRAGMNGLGYLFAERDSEEPVKASIRSFDSFAHAQRTPEKRERQLIAQLRDLGIVSRPFVSHERVLPIELVPGESETELGEPGINDRPSIARNVRILASPYHEKLALYLSGTEQRVIVHAGAQTAFMQIGGIKTGR